MSSVFSSNCRCDKIVQLNEERHIKNYGASNWQTSEGVTTATKEIRRGVGSLPVQLSQCQVMN
jgi:hypothetical protein